jgi:hypothetical protein
MTNEAPPGPSFGIQAGLILFRVNEEGVSAFGAGTISVL